MQRAIIPLLVASVQAALHTGSDRAQLRTLVRPEVDQHDKKFFKKDYPNDKRPVADKYYVFDHPYPAVQDSNDYDRDFIKDENSDGGRWKAQMDYDTLRSKIRAAKEKLKKLKEKMEQEYEDWMRAKDREAKGADSLSESEKATEAARKAAEAAAKKVNDLEGRSSKDGTKVGGAIGDAVKKVQDEMSDLEKCKKALAEAKKRLKELLKEKEEFEKKKKAAKEAEEAAAKKAAEDAKKRAEEDKKKKEEEKASKKEAKDDEADRKQKEEEEEEKRLGAEEAWRRKLEKEKKDHAQALKNYEEELRDVKITEDQLARAADNLRKFRRPPYVDDNGGVYNVPESNSFSTHASVAIILAVLAACLAY